MPYSLKYGDRYRRFDGSQSTNDWLLSFKETTDSNGFVPIAGWLPQSYTSKLRGALSDGLENLHPDEYHELMIAFDSLINGGSGGYMPVNCADITNIEETSVANNQYIAHTTTYYETIEYDYSGNPITVNIKAWGTNVETSSGHPIDNSITSPGCDYDALYGFAVEAITSLYLMLIDWYEDEEVRSNGAERLARAWSAVPALGQIVPLDELLNAYDAFYEDGYEALVASWSEAFEQELICELFCYLQDGCKTDVNTIEEFLRAKLQTLPSSIGDIVEVIRWFAGASHEASWYVYACLWYCLQSLRLMNFFGFSNSLDDYKLQLKKGIINPSNDWTVLCDPCLGWVANYNFETAGSTLGWIIDAWGTVTAGGLQGQFSGTTSRLFFFASGDGSTPSQQQNWTWEIEYTLHGVAVPTDGAVPKQIVVAIDADTGNVPNNYRQTFYVIGKTPVLRETFASGQNLGAMNSVVIRNEMKKNNTGETYYITLHRLTLTGDGIRPDWLP